MDFSNARLSYEKGSLLENQLPTNPHTLFNQWVQTAIEHNIVEPYAMSLATCNKQGEPSVRILLMREVIQHDDTFSIVFYTNYNSDKGKDIDENLNAQMLFFWHELERQIRLTGELSKISVEKSSEYFHKRPKDSQIGAWVSDPQSGIIASREQMDQKFEQLQAEYADVDEVPMPEFWGGYQLTVSKVEFWQGRANRMHDRIVYRQDSGNWLIERLLP